MVYAGAMEPLPIDPKIVKYWALHQATERSRAAMRNITDAEAAIGLIERLRDAGRCNLVADVPVAAFMSGAGSTRDPQRMTAGADARGIAWRPMTAAPAEDAPRTRRDDNRRMLMLTPMRGLRVDFIGRQPDFINQNSLLKLEP